MKNLISSFRTLSAGQKFLAGVEILAIAFLAVFLPQQAHAQSGNVYGHQQAQSYSVTETAVVLQVTMREVQPSWQARTAGAGIGAALAAVVASKAAPNNRYAATLLAAPLGALAGERITNATAGSEAQEIVLRVNTQAGSRIVTIVQPAPFDPVVAGSSVYVINTQGTYRVVRIM